jgi:ABC-2 type transport system permease protein
MLWFVSPPLRTLALKEMRIFWRDPSQWSQLFMLGALVVVYVFNIRSLPLDSPFLKDIISVMNIGPAGVVLAAVAARFAFAGVSTEARSFWLIKSSPIDFSKFLWLKFFLFLFPLLALSETLVVVSNYFLGADKYLMIISVSGIFFITVGLTGLGVGLGAIFPVFEHENIAEVAMSTGAIYYMLTSLAYLGVTVMFGVRPVWVYFSKKFLSQEKGGFEVYVCYAVVMVLTALVTAIPMRMGANSLKKMEV